MLTEVSVYDGFVLSAVGVDGTVLEMEDIPKLESLIAPCATHLIAFAETDSLVPLFFGKVVVVENGPDAFEWSFVVHGLVFKAYGCLDDVDGALTDAFADGGDGSIAERFALEGLKIELFGLFPFRNN